MSKNVDDQPGHTVMNVLRYHDNDPSPLTTAVEWAAVEVLRMTVQHMHVVPQLEAITVSPRGQHLVDLVHVLDFCFSVLVIVLNVVTTATTERGLATIVIWIGIAETEMTAEITRTTEIADVEAVGINRLAHGESFFDELGSGQHVGNENFGISAQFVRRFPNGIL